MKRLLKLSLVVFFCCLTAAMLISCKNNNNYGDGETTYTVVFMQDGLEVSSKEYPIGKAPVEKDYPEIEGKRGYHIVWEDVDFSSAKDNDRVIVTASYVANIYTVSYEVDGGVAITVTTQVTFDCPYTLETASKTGMIFEYWSYIDESTVYTFYITGDKWAIDKDITVKAVYSPNSYTVTYDADGGDLVKNETFVRYGQPYFLETPTKDGFVFMGWKMGNTPVDISGNSWQYAKNVTLTAVWEEEIPETYTLTFDMEGTDNDISLTVEKGKPFTSEQLEQIPTLTPIDGYDAGWAKNGAAITLESLLYSISENTIVAPIYTARTFTVFFLSDGVEAQPCQTVTYLENYNFGNGPTKNNLVFDGWYYEGTKVELTDVWELTPDSDEIELIAKWKVKVTFVQNGEILGEKLFDIGSSLSKQDMIPCENADDSDIYWYWPNLNQYKNLTENITIHALQTSYWVG